VVLNLWVGPSVTVAHAQLLRQLQEYARAHPLAFFVILGLVYVGKSGLNLLANYASIAVALRIADEWRLRLLGGLLRVPARSVPPKQGVLLQLVLDEPTVAGLALAAAGVLVQNVAAAAIVYATLFWISPAITLALTLIGGVAAAAMAVVARYSRVVAEQRSQGFVDGYGYLTEMLGALKQIRIFGLEPAVEARADVYVTRMRTAQRRSSMISSSPRILIEMVFLGAAVLTLAVMSPRIGDAAVLSGAALVAVSAMRLLPAFSAAAGTWVQVQQGLPSLRRIRGELERLESDLETSTGDGRRPAAFARGLECRGVRFSYPERPPVLRGVDVRIEAGSFVALVGPSGSGKSTLVDLLCGLHAPDAGEILIDGTDLRTISKPQWRSLLGVVPQDAFLWSGTLRENLCLLRPDCPEDLLRESLAAVGADKLIAELPAGLDTVVGERGVSLSGGQRQRLALARVLMREPKVLILDEATSALDAESDEAVFAGLEGYRDRMTIIAIAHRLSSVRHADRIYVMQDGVVTESGDHDTLLRRKAIYAAMWHSAERHRATAAVTN
jgi:ABC-type multidrug transport system fused ATPase/permease subunit